MDDGQVITMSELTTGPPKRETQSRWPMAVLMGLAGALVGTALAYQAAVPGGQAAACAGVAACIGGLWGLVTPCRRGPWDEKTDS
jgi:H+/Cl- antiporter ClcA